MSYGVVINGVYGSKCSAFDDLQDAIAYVSVNLRYRSDIQVMTSVEIVNLSPFYLD